jgi:rSAM/selenodomain-associated transferase 1
MNAERPLVQVFAKAPVPGRVKTRLIPHLGVAGATELYCRMLQRTLATVAIARAGSSEMWTTEPASSALLQSCCRLLGVPVRQQEGADLGERLSHAACDGLTRSRHVLVVGADIPAMTPDDLREARSALLAGTDAVLGPAEDGGYWLIGLRRHDPRVFQGIEWGGSDVAERTRDRMRELGWAWHELPPRWDVDRPEDLQRLSAQAELRELLEDLPRAA